MPEWCLSKRECNSGIDWPPPTTRKNLGKTWPVFGVTLAIAHTDDWCWPPELLITRTTNTLAKTLLRSKTGQVAQVPSYNWGCNELLVFKQLGRWWWLLVGCSHSLWSTSVNHSIDAQQVILRSISLWWWHAIMESSTMIASGMLGDYGCRRAGIPVAHLLTISSHHGRGVANVWTLRMATLGKAWM